MNKLLKKEAYIVIFLLLLLTHKVFAQHVDDSWCGIKCILAVCRYYGITPDPARVNRLFRYHPDGMSMYQLSRILV